MTQHILIVEDEKKLASVLSDYLEAVGMQVTHVADGIEVLEAVDRIRPDLLLLDIMLPNKDGMTICRELRSKSKLPIIMLTARVEEIDRLLGLELGADDYICKPFSPREVVARVKANLRRAQRIPRRQQHDDRNRRIPLAGHRQRPPAGIDSRGVQASPCTGASSGARISPPRTIGLDL